MADQGGNTMLRGRGGKPRLSDIADALGVAISSVSRALRGEPGISDDLRRRVVDEAHRLGYEPAADSGLDKSGALLRSVTVLTCTRYLTDSSNNYYNAILESVRATCAQHGIGLESHVIDSDAPRLAGTLEALRRGGCESLLSLGLDEPEYLNLVRAVGVPAVIVSGDDLEMQIDSVSPAFRAGAHLATRHLIECGHREILHVTALHRSTCRKRLDGFHDALRAAGLPFRDDMVINLASYAADFVEHAMAERLAAGRLEATAVFCVTDSAALGLISALRRAGYSVPGDISVAGFDDMPMSALFAPRLTTIHVDREAIGRAAVERLIARVASPRDPAWRIELGGHLVVRDSVGPV